MDKRLFLALILTAIVIAVTPILFPQQRQAARRAALSRIDSLRADSVRRAQASAATDTAIGTSTGATTAAIGAAPATGDSAAAAGSAPGSAAAAGQPGVAAAVPAADTTIVSTPLADYRFSSLGAAPVSVTMKEYRSLRAGDDSAMVTIGAPGQRLLDYALVGARGPGDTVSLARVPFGVSRSLGQGGVESVRYAATVGNSTVTITYDVVPDSYTVKVRGQVTGDARFVLVRLPRQFRSHEADSVEDARNLAYAYKPVTGDASSIGFGKLDPGEKADNLAGRQVSWVAAKSKYFIVGLLTEANDTPFAELSVQGAPRTQKTASAGDASVLEQLVNGQFAFELYTGPQEWRRLRAMGRDFDQANPYGGWFQGMIQPFATLVMRALLWMHETFNLSYGWVLVVFGVVVRLVLWPLNQKAMRSSMKMQRLQPELQAIQAKYREDPARLQQEMMKVYKAHGMTPFSAFGGCLPALIPMPVLIALFFVFQNTIVFRGVSFLWLPDISLMDPYYILPLVVGVTGFLVAWIGMRGQPPNPQAKMMAYIFPPMMTILFLKWASGLNLYYAVQNIATIPQQWLLSKERLKAGPMPTPVVTTPAPVKPAAKAR